MNKSVFAFDAAFWPSKLTSLIYNFVHISNIGKEAAKRREQKDGKEGFSMDGNLIFFGNGFGFLFFLLVFPREMFAFEKNQGNVTLLTIFIKLLENLKFCFF